MSARPSFDAIVEDVLRAGRAVSFVAPGTSMEPTIHDGETITVEPRRPEEVRRGQIAVYASPAGLRAHRLIRRPRRRSGSFTVRGDAAQVPSESVPLESILGIAVAVGRPGGQVSLRSARIPLLVRVRRLRFIIRALFA